MDPRHWLEDYAGRIEEIRKKSVELQENVANAGARVESKDGSVTVTVNPNGGLQNLQLGHRACDLGPARLTTLIMETVRQAQRQAAANVVAAFEPFGGGTEAMRLIVDSIPTDGDEDAHGDYDAYAEPEPEPVRPPVPQPAPAPSRPVRRPAAADDVDDDNRPW
ncbi:YbaB/EbfC family nucleoid-associated protein [Saccharothrix violaceirubra]|uniref:DNA-binding protein YbaB n=1 Tax=Saccharothrix violaceirubra TaxID=413306 RepID=A0A7W7SY66_9PSEU|nr:YbaB/EbfC family nucleoid-associated protein [Saccharothrix violaceirubra]MBB4963053.1 DNA-binding protein YbaB [Saccharothrix violaceirubra]